MEKSLFRVRIKAKQTWIAEIFADDEYEAEEMWRIKVLENIVEEIELWTKTKELSDRKPSGKYVCYEQVPGTCTWRRITPEE